jgi:excisionase family DNA binding protein
MWYDGVEYKETAMTYNHPEPIVPSDQDAVLATKATRALEQHRAGNQSLRVQIAAAGHEVTALDLPPLVVELLMSILKETAAGHAVTLVPLEAEITTQEAAELLNVSRPYVVGMIDKGQLPARMVGNQRRLPLKDVLTYRAENRAKRLETLKELVAHDQKLGLYNFE